MKGRGRGGEKGKERNKIKKILDVCVRHCEMLQDISITLIKSKLSTVYTSLLFLAPSYTKTNFLPAKKIVKNRLHVKIHKHICWFLTHFYT